MFVVLLTPRELRVIENVEASTRNCGECLPSPSFKGEVLGYSKILIVKAGIAKIHARYGPLSLMAGTIKLLTLIWLGAFCALPFTKDAAVALPDCHRWTLPAVACRRLHRQ